MQEERATVDVLTRLLSSALAECLEYATRLDDQEAVRLDAIAEEFEKAIPTHEGQVLGSLIRMGVTALESHIKAAFSEAKANQTAEAGSDGDEELRAAAQNAVEVWNWAEGAVVKESIERLRQALARSTKAAPSVNTQEPQQ